VKYVLGVDGGGTKTTAAIAAADGRVIAESTTGASNIISVGRKKAAENLNRVVSEAAEFAGIPDILFSSSCFGFAGLNVDEDLEDYRDMVLNMKMGRHLDHKKLFICNDTRIGLEAGSSAPNRIIIIAGTGSNCLGIDQNGRQATWSGWDYILSDEGSGYRVGVKALRAVTKAYDGRGRKTMLTGAVLEELKLKSETDIIRWTYNKPFSKKRLGMFARVVCSCAQKGDAVSRDILREEAGESVLSVTTVATKLGFEKKEFDLVFVGGLFKCAEFFKDIVMGKLQERFEMIRFTPLETKPVEGALKLAIGNLKQ